MTSQFSQSVEGGYFLRDLVDLDRLRQVLENLSLITGLSIGLIEYPSYELLFRVGWREICTDFHRRSPESAERCRTNIMLLAQELKEPGQIAIRHCENGLVDGVTPVFVEQRLMALLATGQVLLEQPDLERFRRQAELFGFDVDSYLAALSKVPVVSERDFRKVLSFLNEIALMIAELGLNSLLQKKVTQDLEAEISRRLQVEEALLFGHARLETLVTLSQMQSSSLKEITDFALEEAVRMTRSSIGYLAFANEDETVLTIYSWSRDAMRQCAIKNKPIVFQLASTGLWGEAIRQRKPIITNDYDAPNPHRRGYPEGHVRIRRHMNIPVFDQGRIVIVAGVGNKEEPYNETDVHQLNLLMDGMWKIIQHQMAQKALRESEKQYRSLVGNIPGVAYKGYKDWRIEVFEDKIEVLTGYSKEQFNSGEVTWLDLIHPDDIEPSKNVVRQAIKGNGAYVREHRIEKRDGQLIWVQDRGQVTPTQEGGFDHVDGVFFDITERKQLEEQLVMAQKLEALGVLAGGVAHDFNNLLTAIAGHAELMLLDSGFENPNTPHALEILKAAERGASLTQQLLAFGRKQILSPRVHDLNDIVRNMEGMLHRLIGEDIELVTVLAPGLGAVRVDSNKIEQIIFNLAANARDAMPLGGRLTIETDNTVFGKIPVRNREEIAPGLYVMLAITDNGVGMDAQTQARVFEPFFTTKDPGKGTGLGLASTYGIVKQSGGYIYVFSQPGWGTTFQIYLPRVDEIIERFPETRAAAVSLPGTETILVVEDEEGVRAMVCQALRTHGYNVLEARDGEEALRICEQEKPVHLLLTDVVMPKMSGRELAERLQPLHPEMRVLYMTGYTEDSIVRHGVLDHGVTLIQKPFSLADLARTVRRILDPARSS